MEERFHQGVVIAIPRRTHALNETMLLHKLSKSITGILGPPIGMEHKACIRFPLHECLVQSICKDPMAQRIAHRPSNDLAVKNIQDRCQIKPTFSRPNKGNIGNPNLVSRFRQNRPRVPSENGRQFRCKSATPSERSDAGFLALSHNDFMTSSQNASFS